MDKFSSVICLVKFPSTLISTKETRIYCNMKVDTTVQPIIDTEDNIKLIITHQHSIQTS
jgi:hypothetical protein